MKRTFLALLLISFAPCATALEAPSSTGVPGVDAAQLEPGYWIARQPAADAPVLDAAAIAAQNARLVAQDPSVHDIEHLPAQLARADVRAQVEKLSQLSDAEMFDQAGVPLRKAQRRALLRSLALDRVPAQTPVRHAMVVRRAKLRTFPTYLRVFSERNNTDIDRFQENALFPGTPLALLHESRDRKWWFVLSPLYAAWIEKQYVAEGSAAQVFGYGRKSPYLVVTGANARTVFTPQQPQLSLLQLDMGVRVPLLADWPAGQPVNGQHPSTAHVVELPLREPDGKLAFAPALLPRTADVARDYLPLSRANVLRQGFKFLGERYGWGHDYDARDCSGFVSEVYRSFGVTLPRNTRDQAISPAFDRIAFAEGDGHDARIAVLRTLDVGDLVYIPGHVMMVVGHDRDTPYVIHDTTGAGFAGADGAYVRVPLNGVVVTPLFPMLAGDGQPTIDRITSIQRMRRAAPEREPTR